MQVFCKHNILVHLFLCVSLSSLLISRKEDLLSLSTTNLCKFNTTLISHVLCNDDYWFVNSNAKFFIILFSLDVFNLLAQTWKVLQRRNTLYTTRAMIGQ